MAAEARGQENAGQAKDVQSGVMELGNQHNIRTESL